MGKSIKRGEVWYYIPTTPSSGSVQRGPRPVIIVSNDILNETSSVVLGVPCTTKIKRNFATHALFIMKGKVNVALTEQIMPINVDELTTFEYRLEDYVMNQIDQALLTALSLTPNDSDQHEAEELSDDDNVNNSVDNVNKKPKVNQVTKFYNRYEKHRALKQTIANTSSSQEQ